MAYLYITFDSHYHALLARRTIGENCFLAPVPRLISSSCASCVKMPVADAFPPFERLEGIEGAYVLDGERLTTAFKRR